MIKDIVKDIDDVLDIHDFRVVKGPTQTKLIFDVAMPSEIKKSEENLIKEITEKVKKVDKKVKLFITVDKNYIL